MNFSENFSINKKANSLPKIFTGSAVLILSVLILNFFSPVIKNSFYALSSPIEKVFWQAGAASSSYVGSFFKAGYLNSENDRLKNENQKLISQIVSLQAVNGANQAQTDVSLSCLDKGFNLVMAGVMGLDGQDVLSINKGQDDGIAIGMPVISQQNVLYGKVIKIYKNYSQIMLISSTESIINAKIQQNLAENSSEAGEIDGIAKGLGNSGLYLDLVPVDSVIKEGDVLITSSLEKVFPKDLLIGQVGKVEKNDQKPFQQAEIKPFLNLSGTDNLFIITNYKR